MGKYAWVKNLLGKENITKVGKYSSGLGWEDIPQVVGKSIPCWV